MKKVISVIFALLLSVTVLCGCTKGPTVDKRREDAEVSVTPESVDENLRYFLGITDSNSSGDLGNRAPSSDSETAAAQRLYDKYNSEEYPNLEVNMLNFAFTANGEELTSQNVEVRLRGENSDGTQVIIGTGYDNSYGKIDEAYSGKESSTGAFAATGVATLMSIIDSYALNGATVGNHDLVFVFFGCSVYNSCGSQKYIKEMDAPTRKNTSYMINIGHFGGERMYIYSDEVETEFGKYLRYDAIGLGLQYFDLPQNLPIISDASYIEDINYVHYGMLSDHASFMEINIPSAYIFSGYYGGFNLSELEKKGESNIIGTKKDTYDYLTDKRSDWAQQASDTASLVSYRVGLKMTDPNYYKGMYTIDGKSNYKTWTKPLWAYLTVIFVIIALCIVLIVLVKHFEKKYPFIPVIKRMKIAVFGMEYEDKNDQDIFIDIKKPRNPFDGY